MAASGSKEYQLAIKIAGKVDPSLGKAVESAQGTLSKLGSLAGTVAKAGAVAIAAATAATLAFATSAVDAGMQFDTAMSQVAATMGTTVDQIGELQDFALEMGSTTAFSATEAAEGLNVLAMAGLEATDQIAALPDVLDLAAAGAISLENAASYTVGAVKGFSDEMGNAHYYADLIAKGATLANTSVEGLGEALSRSAATASSYGQEADSVTLSLLRLANQNITGEAAATALNRAMSDLYAPTASAKKVLAELGVSAYDVATGAARDFNDIVADLSNALSGMTDEQANAYAATIFTTQGLNAFNKMTAATDETMRKFTDGLADVDGSAAMQAATQLDNLAGDITLFKSALEGAQINVYKQLSPSLRGFVQFGTEAISTLSDSFKEGGLSGAMEALGGGIISDGLNMAIAELPGMTEAGMQLLGALSTGLKDNLPMITDAATQIALMLIMGLVDATPDIADSAVEIIATLANGLGDALPELTPAVVDMILRIVETLTDPQTMTMLLGAAVKIMGGLVQGLVTSIPRLVEAVPIIMANLTAAILAALPTNQILSGIQNGLNAIGAFLQERFPVLTAYFTGWVSSVSAALDNFRAVFLGIIDFIRNVFTGNWSAAWQNIRDIFGNLFGGIVNLAKAPMNGVISLINSVLEKVNGISLTIPDWVPGVGGKPLGFNLPTIPQLAQGGIVDSPTLLEAGEAGTEAIIPLSELWKQMQGMVDDSLKSAPLVPELLNELKVEKGGGQPGGNGNGVPINIYYSPENHYHFEGAAPSREDLTAAEKMSQDDFNRMAKQWMKDLDRTKF